MSAVRAGSSACSTHLSTNPTAAEQAWQQACTEDITRGWMDACHTTQTAREAPKAPERSARSLRLPLRRPSRCRAAAARTWCCAFSRTSATVSPSTRASSTKLEPASCPVPLRRPSFRARDSSSAAECASCVSPDAPPHCAHVVGTDAFRGKAARRSLCMQSFGS